VKSNNPSNKYSGGFRIFEFLLWSEVEDHEKGLQLFTKSHSSSWHSPSSIKNTVTTLEKYLDLTALLEYLDLTALLEYLDLTALLEYFNIFTALFLNFQRGFQLKLPKSF